MKAWLGQLLTWVGDRKWARVAGAVLVGAVAAVPLSFLGDKASGGDTKLMVTAELAGNGSQIHSAPPADGRHVFLVGQFERALAWDVPFILVYGAVLIALLWLVVPFFRLRLLRTKGPGITMGAAFAAMGLDLGEDALLLIGTRGDDLQGPDWVYVLAAAFASAKFVVLVTLVLVAFAGFLIGLFTPAWLFAELHADSLGQRQRPPPEHVSGFSSHTGISLSGGGVRAASLALGTLQELERAPEPGHPAQRLGWEDVNAVTAVSGGAYMAGAWQLGRRKSQPYRGWADDEPDGKPGPEERHLLQNLGYLASTWPRGRELEPAGPSLHPPDKTSERVRNSASVWATLAVGFVVNAVVIMATLVVIEIPLVLALDWLVSRTARCDLLTKGTCVVEQRRMWAPAALWLLVGALASAFWLLASKAPGIRKRIRILRGLKAVTRGGLALGVLLAVLLLGFPLLIAMVYHGQWQSGTVSLTALGGTLAAIVRTVRSRAPGLAPKLGGIAFAVLIVAATSWFAVVLLRFDDAGPIRVILIVSAVWLLGAHLIGPEVWSMFAFYRGKLRLAYAVRRLADYGARPYVNDNDSSDETVPLAQRKPIRFWRADAWRLYVEEPTLADLATDVRTSLTICAASHATTRGVKTHYQIPAMSFTLGSDVVQTFEPVDDDGSYRVYSVPTQAYEAAYGGSGGWTTKRISTMFAVALAGAAVAPVMGRIRAGPTSMLITFGNVRLGAWLPNPRYLQPKTGTVLPPRKLPKVRLGYLYKEFLGIHDPADPYVYVSDGGHWENTGLVELLRGAMPREVVCVDADPGRASSVHQIAQAIDLAKLECDVDIFMNLEPLRGFPAEPDGPVFAQRSVNIGLMRRGNSWGLLWHCKPALSLTSPAPLLAHREIDAQFPHTSTVDQFFDTATYVAYRDLGRDNAAEIKKARDRLGRFLFGKQTPKDVLAAGDDEDEVQKYAWVAGAFLHLFHQVPEGQRDEVLDGVRAALGALVRASEPPTPPSEPEAPNEPNEPEQLLAQMGAAI